MTILSFLIHDIFFSKKKNYTFRIIILLVILFDIIILGIYFGTHEILDRFLFLKEEFTEFNNANLSIYRLEIIKFSIIELKNYLLFGFGAGAYEIFFQNNFNNSSNLYANHAHSDIVEFIGEFGLVGFLILFISLLISMLKKKKISLTSFILIIYCFVILSIDFSLHIPLVQMLFIFFFSLKQNKINQLY